MGSGKGRPHVSAGAPALLRKGSLPFRTSRPQSPPDSSASPGCPHRLESGGSNPTASDSYGDRASARARREAREARLANLASRVDEDSSRDYKKVASCSACGSRAAAFAGGMCALSDGAEGRQ